MEAHHVRTTAEFHDTDKLELSLTIRMPLRDWKALIGTMNEMKYPAFQLADHIRRAISKAEAQVVVTADGESAL